MQYKSFHNVCNDNLKDNLEEEERRGGKGEEGRKDEREKYRTGGRERKEKKETKYQLFNACIKLKQCIS